MGHRRPLVLIIAALLLTACGHPAPVAAPEPPKTTQSPTTEFDDFGKRSTSANAIKDGTEPGAFYDNGGNGLPRMRER